MTDPARTLARWCSLTVLAEPGLIRSLRLRLTPEADVSAEADLWWSSLVESRTTRGIVLTAAAAEAFRRELRELHRQHDPRPAEAWRIVLAHHRVTTPAVALEEEIAWLFVSKVDPGPAIERRLRAALAALVNERRIGLGQWAGRAIPRLPELARQQPSAWYLEQAAHAQLPQLASLGTLPPGQVDPAVLARVAEEAARVPLGVLRVGDRLHLGDVGIDGHAVDVPAADPRTIEVVWPEVREPFERSGPDSGSERRLSVDIAVGAAKRIDVGWGPVRLQNTFGNGYDLPPLDGLDIQGVESSIVVLIDEPTGTRRLGVTVGDDLVATVSSTDTEESPAVLPLSGSRPLQSVVLRRRGSTLLLQVEGLPRPAVPVRRLRRPPEPRRRWYGIAVGTTDTAWEAFAGLVRESVVDDITGSPMLLQSRSQSARSTTQVTTGGPLFVNGEVSGLLTNLVAGADFEGDGDLAYGDWSNIWALLHPEAAQASPEQWLHALGDLLQALCLELHAGFPPLGGLELQDDRLTKRQLHELQRLAEAVVGTSIRDLLTLREVLAEPAGFVAEAKQVAGLDLGGLLSMLTGHDPRDAEPPFTATFVDKLLAPVRESIGPVEPVELAFRIRIESVLAPAWRPVRDRLAVMETPGFSRDLTLPGLLDALLRSYGRIFAHVADRYSTRPYVMGYSVPAGSLRILPVLEFFELDELDVAEDARRLSTDRFATVVALYDWARAELLDALAALDLSVSTSRPPRTQPDGYRYDVFISYSRSGGTADWVRNHLFPLLKDTLTDELGVAPQIFFDAGNLEVGASWPEQLTEALKRSRMLLAVLSPPYFRSSWCLSEWESMAARERLLGEEPGGLILPIVAFGGDAFPKEAQTRQSIDMSQWAIPFPQFRETTQYVEFYQAVRGLAEVIAKNIERAPPWQEDFPIIPAASTEPNEAGRLPLRRL